MIISSLEIENLRIIERLCLDPSPGINVIVGSNGAGKTSLLEAIYLAGRGRTFRHPDAGPMIRTSALAAQVLLRTRSELGGRESTLGIRRGKQELQVRYNGKDVHRRSALAEALPVQWIGSQPQLLLDSGPDIRRRFIDMGVFHVEHGFVKALSELSRILKQRNAVLRMGQRSDALIWDQGLIVAANQVTSARLKFIDELGPRVKRLLSDWNCDFSLTLRYRKGWPADTNLEDQLTEKLERDLERGFTSVGPQRADLDFLADGQPAAKRLSRGQQKLVVLATQLTVHDLVEDQQGTKTIFLIDDLGAELDQDNRERILKEIEDRGGQAFLTAIGDNSLEHGPERLMFHVERGVLKCL